MVRFFSQLWWPSDADRSIALAYAKENSMFEGGEQEVSVTQLQWLYFATYKLALKLINSPGVIWATSVLNHSKDVCFESMRYISDYFH